MMGTCNSRYSRLCQDILLKLCFLLNSFTMWCSRVFCSGFALKVCHISYSTPWDWHFLFANQVGLGSFGLCGWWQRKVQDLLSTHWAWLDQQLQHTLLFGMFGAIMISTKFLIELPVDKKFVYVDNLSCFECLYMLLLCLNPMTTLLPYISFFYVDTPEA